MLCTHCKAKAVCKHYDYIANAKEIICDVTKCDVFVGEVPNKSTEWKSYGTKVDFPQVQEGHFRMPTDPNPKVALLAAEREERQLRDLSVDYSEISNKIRRMEGFSIEDAEIENTTCPICKAEIDKDNLFVCDKCQENHTCINCADVDIDMETYAKHVTCPTCALEEEKKRDEALGNENVKVDLTKTETIDFTVGGDCIE